MKTKIIIQYCDNRRDKIVYEGEFNAYAMGLQTQWVLKAKKDANIKAVIWG